MCGTIGDTLCIGCATGCWVTARLYFPPSRDKPEVCIWRGDKWSKVIAARLNLPLTRSNVCRTTCRPYTMEDCFIEPSPAFSRTGKWGEPSTQLYMNPGTRHNSGSTTHNNGGGAETGRWCEQHQVSLTKLLSGVRHFGRPGAVAKSIERRPHVREMLGCWSSQTNDLYN